MPGSSTSDQEQRGTQKIRIDFKVIVLSKSSTVALQIGGRWSVIYRLGPKQKSAESIYLF